MTAESHHALNCAFINAFFTLNPTHRCLPGASCSTQTSGCHPPPSTQKKMFHWGTKEQGGLNLPARSETDKAHRLQAVFFLVMLKTPAVVSKLLVSLFSVKTCSPWTPIELLQLSSFPAASLFCQGTAEALGLEQTLQTSFLQERRGSGRNSTSPTTGIRDTAFPILTCSAVPLVQHTGTYLSFQHCLFQA